jgi:hypothetical protein
MRTRELLSIAAAAACVLGSPRLARAQDAEVVVRVPGHWETRTEVRTAPGHWEQHSKVIWRPSRVEIEARTTQIAGSWTEDVAGNKVWVPGRTVVQNVAVEKPGEWKTVVENVWIAESQATVERQFWVPDRVVRRSTPTVEKGPWDETPRTREPVLPRVTVEDIRGTAPLSPWNRYDPEPPSRARQLEPLLPTQPRLDHPEPWPGINVEPRTVSPRPPVRNVTPLVLVERTDAPPPQPPVFVVAPPVPEPRVVFVPRREAPVVYLPSPRTPYYPTVWDERPLRVGVGVGISVGVGRHGRVGFGIGW